MLVLPVLQNNISVGTITLGSGNTDLTTTSTIMDDTVWTRLELSVASSVIWSRTRGAVTRHGGGLGFSMQTVGSALSSADEVLDVADWDCNSFSGLLGWVSLGASFVSHLGVFLHVVVVLSWEDLSTQQRLTVNMGILGFIQNHLLGSEYESIRMVFI